MKKNVPYRLLVVIFFFLLGSEVFSQDWGKPIHVGQADPRFTLIARRFYNFVHDEEYRFYVQNNTSTEYEMVIEVSMNLACGESKTYKLGINRVVHLMPNGKFDAFKDDWSHLVLGKKDYKDCRNKDGDSYTYYNGMSYQITSIRNISAEKAEEQKKKEAKQKSQDEIKAGQEKMNAKDYDGAIAHFETAKQLDPQNTYIQPKIDLAKQNKQAAIDKNKKEEEKKTKVAGLIQKGDDSAGRSNFKEAEGFYKEALAADPSNESAKTKLAAARDNQKKADEKIAGDKKIAEAKAGTGGTADKKTGSDEGKTASEEKKGEEGRSTPSQKSSEQLRADEEEAARQEEARKAEAERKRKIQEEKERIERKNQYDQKNDQVREDNEKTAMELLIMAAMVHIGIAKLIYENVGEDTYASLFKDDSYLFRAKAGYGMTSVPTFFNSSSESYDGNTLSYTNETEDRQVTTLDLQGGLEFWPLYGKKNGLGVFGSFGAGHGLLFKNFTVFAGGGIRAFAGGDKLKLFSEYSFGYRAISMNNWTEPTELGSGGTTYSYQRLKLGPRFSFKCDFMGETTGNFDILPMFELPDYRRAKYFTPLNIRWLNGIDLNLDFGNRLTFNVEYFWRYQRTGRVEYNYDSQATFYGSFIKFSVLRNFDMYGESHFAVTPEKLERFKNKPAFKGIMFFNPSFGWNKGKDLFVTKPNIGFRLGYEHDFKIFHHTNFSTGAGISINNGGRSTGLVSSDTMKTSYNSFFIPTTIRSYINDYSAQRYWVKYGFNHHIAFGKNAQGAGYSESNMKGFISCLSVGLGLDYKMSEKGAFRASVGYERSLAPYYETTKQSIKSNQLTLQLGCVF